jgi:hypothetical protein
MNWRAKLVWADWLLPIGFGVGLCLYIPLGTAFVFGMDEGFELMKGLLVSRGHALYGPFWNDQPPLHTELLAGLFRSFGPSALVGRLLSVAFAVVLVSSFFHVVRSRSGRATGWLGVGMLVVSPMFIQLSVSVMLELPAMSLAVASIWAWDCYRKSSQGRWLVLSAMLFACALQVKMTAVLFGPTLLLEEWAMVKKPSQDEDIKGLKYAERATERIRDSLVWGGIVIVIILLIAVCSYGFGTVGVFWGSHFSSGTRTQVAVEGYAFQIATFADDIRLSVPALAGAMVILRWRRWDLLMPLVLMGTVLFVHINHRPFWPYYQLHLSIPAVWLGAVAVVECFRILRRQPFGSDLTQNIWFGTLLLGWSALTSLAVLSLPGALQQEVARLKTVLPATQDSAVAALKKHVGRVRWIFTNDRFAAFWVGLAIPPELAVIPSKRIWSGQITGAEVVRCLEKYKPELVLIPPDWVENFGLKDYLADHYKLERSGGLDNLLVRNP